MYLPPSVLVLSSRSPIKNWETYEPKVNQAARPETGATVAALSTTVHELVQKVKTPGPSTLSSSNRIFRQVRSSSRSHSSIQLPFTPTSGVFWYHQHFRPKVRCLFVPCSMAPADQGNVCTNAQFSVLTNP